MLFYVLFVCKCVLPPGDNPVAVNNYIISNTPTFIEDNMSLKRVTQFGAVHGLNAFKCTSGNSYYVEWNDRIRNN
jgi:hypothetical protein